MTSSRVLAALGAAITVGLGAGPSASAAGSGTCSVFAHVDFDRDGRIVQSGPGSASCAGHVGPSTVSAAAVPAYVTGSARPGTSPCAPILTAGELRVAPYRLVSFDARPEGMLLTGAWTGVGTPGLTVVRGAGSAEGVRTTLVGGAAFTPDSGRCVLGEVTSGSLRLDLVLTATGSARTRAARERRAATTRRRSVAD